MASGSQNVDLTVLKSMIVCNLKSIFSTPFAARFLVAARF